MQLLRYNDFQQPHFQEVILSMYEYLQSHLITILFKFRSMIFFIKTERIPNLRVWALYLLFDFSSKVMTIANNSGV